MSMIFLSLVGLIAAEPPTPQVSTPVAVAVPAWETELVARFITALRAAEAPARRSFVEQHFAPALLQKHGIESVSAMFERLAGELKDASEVSRERGADGALRLKFASPSMEGARLIMSKMSPGFPATIVSIGVEALPS